MPASTPALALDNITCTFSARAGARGADAGYYTAIKDISLSIAPGEFVSLVGPTGCGKSTLLNVAAGLLAPSAGTVRIHGVELSGINEQAGYMFQADALMPWRSARANGWRAWGSPASKIAIHTSFPAGCASALRSRRC
jgi:NitT/TauT family transport system ATP-binding protein